MSGLSGRLVAVLVLMLMLTTTMSAAAGDFKDQEEIEKARWAKLMLEKSTVLQRTGSFEAVEDWLVSRGFKVILSIRDAQNSGAMSANSGVDKASTAMTADRDGGPPISPMSVNNDVAYGVAVYFNPDTGKYLIEGTWTWNSMSAVMADAPPMCAWPCNIGGLDAGALWISNPTAITITQTWMNTYDTQWFPRTSTSTAWDWNQYGADWRTQDQLFLRDGCCSDYTHYRGVVDLQVTLQPGAHGSTYLKTSYGHTWESVFISSVSISDTGVSISFSGGPQGWQGTSNPVTWNY